MSYPSASTPVPSIHQVPGSGRNKLAFTVHELEAIGQHLMAGIIRQVVKGLFGAVGSQELGVLLGQLNEWANELNTSAADLEAMIESAAQGAARELGVAIKTLFDAWNTFVGGANTALQTGKNDVTGLITGLTAVPPDNVTGLTGRLTHLTAQGLYDAAAGFGNQATSVLRHLDQTGHYDAAQLTGALNTALTVNGHAVGDLLANLDETGNYVDSLAISNITGLATGIGSWLGTGGALPTATTAAISQINNLGGYLTHLSSGGVLALAGLASGALPSGITLAGAQLIGALNEAVTVGGNQIGDLLQNFDSAGQFAASELTGSINTAVTVGETAIGDVASDASNAAAQWSQAISEAAVTNAAALGTAVSDAGTKAQGVVDTIVQTAQNDATLVDQTLATAGDQLTALFSSAPQRLQGLIGDFGVQGFIDALGAHKLSTGATQTLAASVASALDTTPSPTGVDVTIDFTTMVDQSDMSGVMLPGNGTMHIANGQAVVDTFGTSDFEVFPTEVADDYIVIEVTLGSLNSLTKFGNQLLIIGRSNSTRDTYTAIGISVPSAGGPVTIGAYAQTSGITHLIGNTTKILSHAAEDDVLTIIMGNSTALDVYMFEVLQNDVVILGPISDKSLYSQLGSGQRYVGFLLDYDTTQPPAIKKVRYYDNAPSHGDRPFAQFPPNNPLTPGGLYIPSDTGIIMRDNGVTWDRVMGGPLTRFTPPPEFTAQTPLGTTTLGPSADARLLTVPANDSAAIRGEYDTLPSGAYTCAAYIEHSLIGDSHRSGLILTDGTRFLIFGPQYSSAITASATSIGLARYTSASTYSATTYYHSITGLYYTLPNWYAIVDDGINRYYAISYNGTDWITAYSESSTYFLTATGIGWGALSNSATPGFVRLRSFAINQ